jgi:hypothetical protein
MKLKFILSSILKYWLLQNLSCFSLWLGSPDFHVVLIRVFLKDFACCWLDYIFVLSVSVCSLNVNKANGIVINCVIKYTKYVT